MLGYPAAANGKGGRCVGLGLWSLDALYPLCVRGRKNDLKRRWFMRGMLNALKLNSDGRVQGY